MPDKFIVGGDISGNVGSCTTQTVDAISNRISWMKEEVTTIATNSCTGQVEHYHSWQYTFGAFPLLICVTFIISMLSLMFRDIFGRRS